MKQNCTPRHSCFYSFLRLRWLPSLALLALVVLASGMLYAQNRRISTEEMNQITQELSRQAFLDPIQFNEAYQKLKSPEQVAAEARAWLAFSNPEEYTVRYAPKSAARLQAEAEALEAFRHPVLVNQDVQAVAP